MLQKEVIDIIEEFAPLDTQLSYDKCGLKTGDISKDATGVLVCLDLNENVIDEAIKKNCNLIVEHHPTIWHSWTSIDTRYPKVRALIEAVNHNISVYSAHTNVDLALGGLNDHFAKQIGLIDVEAYGEGRIGRLNEPLTLAKYAETIKEILSDETVRIIGDRKKEIKTVACINGAGGGDEETVMDLSSKTDVFVTGEVKYNVARLSKDIGYAIIEVSHFSAEKGFTGLIKRIISDKAPSLPVFEAETLSNPYK